MSTTKDALVKEILGATKTVTDTVLNEVVEARLKNQLNTIAERDYTRELPSDDDEITDPRVLLLRSLTII